MTRSQIKRRFCQFTRVVYVMDLRPVSIYHKAAAYAARNHTCGRAATFN